MSTADAAKRLGRTVRQVHYLIQSGRLTPTIKGNGPRGPMFFNPADVDALAADLEAAS